MVKIYAFLSLFLLFLLLCPIVGNAQVKGHFSFVVEKLYETNLGHAHKKDTTFVSPSVTNLLGTGFIRFYQKFISSQDRPACVFSLSCSHFGLKAIKRKGLFLGILLTADRLQRCNDLARHYYEVDPKTGKLIDPVPAYVFRKEP